VALVHRAQAIARQAGAVAGLRPGFAWPSLDFLRSINIWFWAIVGVPTLFAGVYYFAIASDLYLSEAKFVVRGPSKMSIGGIGALLSSAGVSGNEDTYAVQEFMLSRDAVRQLDQAGDLRAAFSRPEGDFLSRFPGALYWRHDFEHLYKTYAHFVTVEIDTQSGVSTLEVKAYRPEDAQKIAQGLMRFGEKLINDLNVRARDNSLSALQAEVTATEQHIGQTQTQLTAYRIKEQMLDPKSGSAGPLALVVQLDGQQAASRGQLAELLKNSPGSPQIPLMRTRIAALDKLIADERAKITGDTNSVAAAVTEFERLTLQQEIGEKTLASAFASLEAARLEAQRQQLYLDTIAQPNLADYPLYPKRALSFATVFASCLLAYGISWLLIASVREHGAA
jgi:capsular polysaccharide transport system permease protein